MASGILRKVLEPLKTVFQENGTLLTAFAALIIIVSGVSIVDNRENWWVPVIAVTGFFLVVFLFLNLRVVLKASLTSLVAVTLSAYAFELGTMLDIRGSAGLLWMGQLLSMFLGLLSFSYLTISRRSRWTLALVATLTSFMVTFVLIIGLPSPVAAIAAGALAGVVVFVPSYRDFRVVKWSAANMPSRAEFPSSTFNKIVNKFEKKGWKHATHESKHGNSLMVWHDRAFVLVPVAMNSPFGTSNKGLAYEGRRIDRWLVQLLREAPSSKAAGAPVHVVLVDLNGRNGNEARSIAVAVPDSKKEWRVHIANPSRVFDKVSELDEQLSRAGEILDDKHRIALAMFGQYDEREIEFP